MSNDKPKHGQECWIIDDFGERVKAMFTTYYFGGSFDVGSQILKYRD